jgi:SAM-dependent methyltransferase
MLIPLDQLAPLLRSPRSGMPLTLSFDDARLVAVTSPSSSPGHTAEAFAVVDGIPVLVDFDRSVLDRDATLASGAMSRVTRRTSPAWRFAQRVVGGSPTIARRKCAELVERLVAERNATAAGERPFVIVAGGGTIGGGAQALYDDARVDVAGFDIYASPNVQIVADAHAMPLADGCADAVWIQAVLEHVLDPAKVVSEIARVLRPGGYVYAETPFMQQVHEGAYDFTRFTQSGHRWLFRAFDSVDEGVIDGPSGALRWAVRYFVAGLTRSRTAGAIAGASLFWLRFLDPLVDPRHASDGAGCLYFFGRKRADAAPLSPHEAIAAYRGAQQ